MKFFATISALFLGLSISAQITLYNLRCEQLVNPVGIGEHHPRLSWQIKSEKRGLRQIAYEVQVASTPEKLKRNNPDQWNTGKVLSDASILVPYKGKAIQKSSKYFWKVKVYTNKGESGWSDVQSWQTGLLAQSDWHAKWIGYDKAFPWDSVTQWSRLSARYFRKSFQSVGQIKEATLHIVGLGMYELYLNGDKIGNQVLAPAPTDYRKTVLSNTFDVTKNLRDGQNVLGVILGNGRFFTMRQNYKPQKINNFGYPKLLFQLEIRYADGTIKTIISDDTWKFTADGPIRSNNEYDGEEYDATKELTGWDTPGFDDSKWLRAQLVKSPGGKIVPQLTPPMRIMDTIRPVILTSINNKTYVLDMGQNFAGWLQIKVKGTRGDKVKLRFAESLQPDGAIYVANLRDAKVTDVYTLKGGGVETWRPNFVYHGFRYVEISDFPGVPQLSDFEGHVIFDDMTTIGHIETSNNVLNRIVKNAWWGIASNYKGMPVDCPQRNERQPWLGDRAQGAFGESFLFGNASLYAKWLDDIEQSQTPEGAIPDVAPAFWNYYSDNVTWPGTYILVADMLHRQFGDVQSVTKHYASMKKWMNYMRIKYMKDFIINKDKYGDWCVPPESLELIRSRDSLRNTKGELIATAYYYHLLQIMKRFALISNNDKDSPAYESLAANIREAFNSKFFDATAGKYDNNTVTANLLPLYFGMVPRGKEQFVFEQIIKKIQADKMHISTGVIGTQWLMRSLTKYGQPEVAYRLAGNTTYPGWGYMIEQGATTIWELWNGNTASPQMNSQNHVMLLGDLLIWMFEDLAGMKSSDAIPAFKKITMKPAFDAGLDSVNASYQSPYGEIKSRWKKESAGILWEVTVPANASAEVYFPAKSMAQILESGRSIQESEGLKWLRKETKYMVFELGSGHYHFNIKD